MRTRFYFNQDDVSLDQILFLEKKNPSDEVIIVSDTEWEYQLTHIFVRRMKSLGIKVRLLLGSFDDLYYRNLIQKYNLSDDAVINWPTFWFNWGELCLKNVINYKDIKYNNFKNPFIFLNNKAHQHRCSMIDAICKHDLLDKGKVSWIKFTNSSYNFQHFDDSFLEIGDKFSELQDSFVISEHFYDSLFHVIGEATTKVPFITEKTVIPILLKKPFIVYGGTSFNQKLKELGFRLFDDIINYSFDTEKDFEKASEIIAYNVKSVVGYNNLNDLYNELLPIIEHNYNRAQEIIHDIGLIPVEIRNRINNISADDMNACDVRYKLFMDRCHNIL